MVRGRAQSGVAMLMTLVTLFLLGIALALIGGTLAHRLQLTKHEAETVVLSALDDAALAEGLAALAQSAFSSGVPEHPFGDGKIECRIEPIDPTNFHLVATATFRGRQRGAEAWVQRTPGVVRVERWRRLAEQEEPAR